MTDTVQFKSITLDADSIVVVPNGFNNAEIILFEPARSTIELLKVLEQGDLIKKCILIDLMDDGTLDTHVSERGFRINRIFVGDHRKQKTQIISVTYF